MGDQMRKHGPMLFAVALACVGAGTAHASSHNFEIDAEIPAEVGKGANGKVLIEFRYNKKRYTGKADIHSGMTKADKAKAVKDAIDNAETFTGKKPTGVTATVNGTKVEMHAPHAKILKFKTIKLKESDTITEITYDLMNVETGRKKLSYRFTDTVVTGYLASVGFASFLGSLTHSIQLSPGTTGPQATALFDSYFASNASGLAAIGLAPVTGSSGYGVVQTLAAYPFDTPLSITGDGESLELGIAEVPLPAPVVLMMGALVGLGALRLRRRA